MRRRRLLMVLAAAVGSGVLAGWAALRFLQERPTRLVAAEPSGIARPVVVAARDLPLGHVLDPSDIMLVDWPSDDVPIGYATSVDQVVGRGVINGLQRNEPLLDGKLADAAAGGGLPIVIPEGMRALSVRVDEVVGVAGFVLPGTRVDILLTVGQGNSDNAVTRVILQNILTLAAGQEIQRDRDGEPRSVTVITVLVSPVDAEKLALASSQGRIQMALRNTLDLNSIETSGIRMSALLSGGGGGSGARRRAVVRRVEEPESGIIEVYLGGKRTLITY